MDNGFCGGVVDSRGDRAFIPTSADAICAVDLADGVILWKRSQVGRPIAADETRLALLDREGANYFVRVLDAASGADCARMAGLGMPDWAQSAGFAKDALSLDVDAGAEAHQFKLSWTMRRPYRGGAAPSATVQAEAARVERGAALLDLQNGTIRAASPALTPRAPSPGAPPSPVADRDTLATQDLEDRRFVLRVEQDSGNHPVLTLEATRSDAGSRLWKTDLEMLAVGSTKPAPLRPGPPRLRG